MAHPAGESTSPSNESRGKISRTYHSVVLPEHLQHDLALPERDGTVAEQRAAKLALEQLHETGELVLQLLQARRQEIRGALNPHPFTPNRLINIHVVVVVVSHSHAVQTGGGYRGRYRPTG